MLLALLLACMPPFSSSTSSVVDSDISLVLQPTWDGVAAIELDADVYPTPNASPCHGSWQPPSTDPVVCTLPAGATSVEWTYSFIVADGTWQNYGPTTVPLNALPGARAKRVAVLGPREPQLFGVLIEGADIDWSRWSSVDITWNVSLPLSCAVPPYVPQTATLSAVNNQTVGGYYMAWNASCAQNWTGIAVYHPGGKTSTTVGSDVVWNVPYQPGDL